MTALVPSLVCVFDSDLSFPSSVFLACLSLACISVYDYFLVFCPSAGFNPIWNDMLNFTVHVPELALVRFVVEDYDKTSKNDFVGQYTLPFSCLQQGVCVCVLLDLMMLGNTYKYSK